jgi:hypothetical protein
MVPVQESSLLRRAGANRRIQARLRSTTLGAPVMGAAPRRGVTMSSSRVTSMVLFDENRPGSERPKTAIVFGMNRGGTSMVAGTIRGFGFHFGHRLLVNSEDPDFTYKTVEDMRRTILARNACFRYWGWKFPKAAVYLDDLLQWIRSPILIVVARDQVAVSLGLTRWDERSDTQAICESLDQMRMNISLILKWELPTLLVSYEKAVLNPGAFLDEVEAFLNMRLVVSRERLLQFMAAGSYKSYDDTVLGTTP